MTKSEKIWTGIGCALGVCLIAGAWTLAYFSLKSDQSSGGGSSSGGDSQNSTPNISTANTTYTSQFKSIYDLSAPVMFSFNPGNNSDETVFINGTSWVFDRQLQPQNNIQTYYLMTNLHVINLWDPSLKNNENNPNEPFPALENVTIFFGNKGVCPPFASNTMTSNGITTHKWPYIEKTNIGNLFYPSAWIGAKYMKDFDEVPAYQTINTIVKGTNYRTPPRPQYEKWITDWDIYPFGLNYGLDCGIIKIDVPTENIKSIPFLQTFDNLIKGRNGSGFTPVNQIYDTNPSAQSNLKISIGGYPGMQDSKFNYSAWSAWNNTNNNSAVSIQNKNFRGQVEFQSVAKAAGPTGAWTGSAPGANLNHGSSGSMVLNNETNQIEGIYWGGFDYPVNSKDTTPQFIGQFVPFGANGVLSKWCQLVNDNLGYGGQQNQTYIGKYLNNSPYSNGYYHQLVTSILNQVQLNQSLWNTYCDLMYDFGNED